MSSLRETKDRIGSVRNTLKITSAMKLVASSKLHKAQKAIESLRPYEQTLSEIYSELAPVAAFTRICSSANPDAPVALLAVSSNNSLCGAFNVNIIKAADEFMHGLGGREVRVFAVGKKIYDAMRKALPSDVEDLSEMLVRPAYPQSSALATRLINAFLSGEYSRVVLIYNSFVSSSVQKVMVENFLPFEPESSSAPIDEGDLKLKYILEPEPVEIAAALLPQLELPGLLRLPLAPLGALGSVRAGCPRPGRAESQCPPVLQEIGVDLLVPGLRAENDPADGVPRVVLPLVQADPEGIVEQDGELADAHMVSSFE